MLATFPDHIDTSRILIRRYETNDAKALIELICRNFSDLLESFPTTVKAIQHIQQAEVFISNKNQDWVDRKTFCYGIWLKESMQLVGQITNKNIDWGIPSVEISYFIDSEFRRQGFANESLKANLGICQDQLSFKRIFARVLPTNIESIALIEKLGFQREGTLRNSFRTGKHQLCDVLCYSLIK